jgi:hypothetical protein
MVEGRRGLRPAQEALLFGGVALHVFWQELQGDTAVERMVLGEEDFSHAPLADLLEDLVVRDLLTYSQAATARGTLVAPAEGLLTTSLVLHPFIVSLNGPECSNSVRFPKALSESLALHFRCAVVAETVSLPT